MTLSTTPNDKGYLIARVSMCVCVRCYDHFHFNIFFSRPTAFDTLSFCGAASATTDFICFVTISPSL